VSLTNKVQGVKAEVVRVGPIKPAEQVELGVLDCKARPNAPLPCTDGMSIV
jgi:hypothetical protein